ncbi:MAG: hypothetical protein CL946_00750 [Ectothiorhodospiraceae bacterium]|nr:hypothetical protein [Ectothiorhodospiraceae bacterium]
MYGFEDLKETVKREFKVDPDDVESTNVPAEVRYHTPEALNKDLNITHSEIYVVVEGKKFRGFLYIDNGYDPDWVRRKGLKSIIPKFHILNCDVVQEKKTSNHFHGHYVFRTKPVEIEDLDGKWKEPMLCKLCLRNQTEIVSVIDTTEFCEEYLPKIKQSGSFIRSDLPKEYDLDTHGYTTDWDKKSQEYRVKQHFTCEECGIKLNKRYLDGYFLETHHIDMNKTNNADSNLKCLCVLCHANVNELHKRRYKDGKNRKKLEDFLEIYFEELVAVNNQYLNLHATQPN